MSEKTIALTGAETEVHFSGGNAWLRNDGAAVVYAAKTAGVAAGADGVISIPAGQSAPVYGANGTVFLLGSGSVQLIGSDYATNPFDCVSLGGGADIVTDAAEMVTLDGLQGGVLFSDITVSGKNLITEVLSAALGGNSTDGFRITDNPYCRSFVRKLLPNTTYTVKRYDDGNRFRIILFSEYPTNTADTTAIQILNATTTPSEWTFTTGTDHLYFALTTHNGATDKTVVEPIVQLEYGDAATAYEEPIIGQEITLTTCGKNLTPYPYAFNSRVINGVTFTVNDDGSVTIDGTATNTTNFYISGDNAIQLSAGTYCLSGCPSKKDGSDSPRLELFHYEDGQASTSFSKKDYGDGVVFNVQENVFCGMRIGMWEGTVCDGLVFKPQIERGNLETAYEPYSGTTTTITPDSNPYTVPNDIRQQDGINNVSVSAGEVSVTGVKRNAAVKKIWDKLDELTAAIIVSNGETAE